MKVSFVIPTHNRFDLLNQLLVDIHEFTKPDEVIIVDDCSDEKTQNGIWWWSHNFGVKVFRPIKNLGFLKASNYGMKKATGGIICLISTDVRIHRDFIYWMKDELKLNPKKLMGGRLLDWDTGWNTFNGKTHIYLEGWILATGKEQWEELGYFDERYTPNDYEDIDLSTTAFKMKYTLSEFPMGSVSHVGAQSIPYGEARETITKINKEKFKEKWYTKNSKNE